MEVSEEQEQLVKKLRMQLRPWRKLTIGVDGHDGVGKSVLARHLAWDLNLPAIETDMFIIRDVEPPAYRYDDLSRLITAWHALDRPVIMEGVFLLDTLKKIDVDCDFLIYVESDANHSSYYLSEKLRKYDETYKPTERASYRFNCDFVDR